jgi:hypothetical protein
MHDKQDYRAFERIGTSFREEYYRAFEKSELARPLPRLSPKIQTGRDAA